MKHILPFLTIIFIGLGLSACKSGSSTTTQASEQPPDSLALHLDSLVAISQGDYIHLEVGKCYGTCDGHVSIYRTSHDNPYIYDAEAWIGDKRAANYKKLLDYLTPDEAYAIFQQASAKQIMKLQQDGTHAVSDNPYFWLRARIGLETLSLNGAYLGGNLYFTVDTPEKPALVRVFHDVRTVLQQRLRDKP